jgi:ankyrin repeat protein
MTRWTYSLLMLVVIAVLAWLVQFSGEHPPGLSVATAHTESAGQDPSKPMPLSGSLRVLWRYRLPADTRFTPGITSGDLDGDGKAEIIVKSRTGAVVLDGAGRKRGTLPIPQETPLLAMARTPKGPLLIGFDVWSDVTAYDRRGRPLWHSQASDAVDWACPVDIRAPEGDAVAVGCNGSGGVYLLNAEGKVRWHAKGPGNVWSVAAARLTKEGRSSVICTHSGGTILVFNAEGKRLREIKPVKTSEMVYSADQVYAADLDGDGVDEVLGLGTWVSSGRNLLVYNANGKLRWRKYVGTPYDNIHGPISGGRFWPSGHQVAVGSMGGNLFFFDREGRSLPGLKVHPDLMAICTLNRSGARTDALVTVTSVGVVCYEWQNINARAPLVLPGPDPAQRRRPDSPLAEAVRRNDLVTVKALLEKGADPNRRNNQGSPVLSVAAIRGYGAIAQALLEKGANVNARRRERSTVLMDAALGGHLQIVKALLARGADVNAKAERSVTALQVAAISGQAAIVQALLAGGATVNSEDDQGKTALYWAASMGSAEIVQVLLARGAKVDTRDWYGMTPLMGAAMEAHTEAAKILIDHGANVNARADATRLLVGRAGFVGGEAAVRQFLKGKDISVLREDGPSVLDRAKAGAALRGKNEIVVLLEKAGARK